MNAEYFIRAWKDGFAVAGIFIAIGYAIGFGYRYAALATFGLPFKAEDLNPGLVFNALSALLSHWPESPRLIGTAVHALWNAVAPPVLAGIAAFLFKLVQSVVFPLNQQRAQVRQKIRDIFEETRDFVLSRVGGVVVLTLMFLALYAFGTAGGSEDAQAYFNGNVKARSVDFLHEEPLVAVFSADARASLDHIYLLAVAKRQVYVVTRDSQGYVTFIVGKRKANGLPRLVTLSRGAVLSEQ